MENSPVQDNINDHPSSLSLSSSESKTSEKVFEIPPLRNTSFVSELMSSPLSLATLVSPEKSPPKNIDENQAYASGITHSLGRNKDLASQSNQVSVKKNRVESEVLVEVRPLLKEEQQSSSAGERDGKDNIQASFPASVQDIQCSLCKFKTVSDTQLQSHFREIHPDQFSRAMRSSLVSGKVLAKSEPHQTDRDSQYSNSKSLDFTAKPVDQNAVSVMPKASCYIPRELPPVAPNVVPPTSSHPDPACFKDFTSLSRNVYVPFTVSNTASVNVVYTNSPRPAHSSLPPNSACYHSTMNTPDDYSYGLIAKEDAEIINYARHTVLSGRDAQTNSLTASTLSVDINSTLPLIPRNRPVYHNPSPRFPVDPAKHVPSHSICSQPSYSVGNQCDAKFLNPPSSQWPSRTSDIALQPPPNVPFSSQSYKTGASADALRPPFKMNSEKPNLPTFLPHDYRNTQSVQHLSPTKALHVPLEQGLRVYQYPQSSSDRLQTIPETKAPASYPGALPHLKIIPEENRKFTCPYCHAIMYGRRKLIDHVMLHAQNDPSTNRKIWCFYCTLKFIDKKSLMNHMKIHTAEEIG